MPWDNRGHFFAAAAEAMRRILVESARRRPGSVTAVANGLDLARWTSPLKLPDEKLLALDESLTKLAAEEPTVAEAGQIALLCRVHHRSDRRAWESPCGRPTVIGPTPALAPPTVDALLPKATA